MATWVACSGAGHKALLRVDQVARDNTHCPAGGAAVASGVDSNDNGNLDANEVTATAYICNGASAGNGPSGAVATLVRVEPEPAGAHCAQGGVAILAGVDANGNGALDDTEVGSTSYVCDGAGGALVRVTNEAPGAHCLRGGTAIATGIDANHDGVLDAGEITSVNYVCNPATVPPAGDVTIHSAAELGQLTGIGHVDGNLTIDAPDLTTLDLPDLVSVGSNLVVKTTSVTTLRMNRLVRVDGTLDLEAGNVGELSLPALVGANNFTIKGGKGARITLSALTEVPGTLLLSSINFGQVLDFVSLPLRHVGSLQLNGLVGQGYITLPPGLQIDHDLLVLNCDVAELGSNSPIGVHGDVQARSNPNLRSVDFYGSRVDGFLRLEQNGQLSSVGWPTVSDISLIGSAITTLQLDGITQLHSLDVDSNDTLQSITANALSSCYLLDIDFNQLLSKISFPQLRYASSIEVDNNPKLPSCLKAIFDAQLKGTGVDDQWYGNNDLGTCN